MNTKKINPFNPFNESNNATYISPVTQVGKSIKIRHYILPHRDKCDGKEYEDYAGDEGYFENQGFYVYRNFRLITWGTWFRIIDKLNAYKLCRVWIDIGNDEDSQWRIDVKKSNADTSKVYTQDIGRIYSKSRKKGKNVLEQKAKKYSTDNSFDIWNKKIKLKTKQQHSNLIEKIH